MKIYRQSAGGKKPAAVLKRPGAVLKRPAAILKKRAACEAVLGTSEEEDVEARLLQLLILNLLLLTGHLLNITWKIILPKAVESMVL